MDLYLVYDLEIDPTPSPVSLWEEKAADFTPRPVGAYFADDPDSACEQAAKHHGQRGIYAAIETSYRKLDFQPRGFGDKEREKLEKKARKQKKKAAKRATCA